MAKPKITRTQNPIHFEDLDPKRFEDLVRQLLYDFRDWQNIEPTGKSGNDDGLDIRAYEKVSKQEVVEKDDEDEEIQEAHPMEGNLWVVQVKREKEIGPKRIEKIVSEIDSKNPPYGYILAASATFSKTSYDIFRERLREKGVMEFYIWGKPELEDILLQPKNDRILFTFFSISLVSRRRSRTTEIRSKILTKNKLFKIFGQNPGYVKVLVRDLKDDSYPYKGEYPDFENNPRWIEFTVDEFHATGILLHKQDYFAYVDPEKKEYDFTRAADQIQRGEIEHNTEARVKFFEEQELVRNVWNFFPKSKQGSYLISGFIPFENILLIDDKGDAAYPMPHIYVDFTSDNGPFLGYYHTMKIGERVYIVSDKWKQIKVFPEKN